MNTLHKQVLTLLGFTAVGHGIAPIGGQWALFNDNAGKFTLDDGFGFETEADAWGKAPTLDALMPKLIEFMRGIEFAEICISFERDGAYDLVLFNSGEAIYAVEKTLAEAVAALFIAACEDELIKPETVVL